MVIYMLAIRADVKAFAVGLFAVAVEATVHSGRVQSFQKICNHQYALKNIKVKRYLPERAAERRKGR